MTIHITKTWFDGEKVVTQEIPESEVYKQEPVAFVTGTYGGRFTVKPLNPAMVLPVNMALYTIPPAAQRQWVGLTDEERKEIAEQCIQPLIFLVKDHAISIEAKLKERNT